MNPFATPDGSATGGSVTGSGSGSATMPPGPSSGTALRDSSAISMTESQPTLRDFPHPPSKNPLRVGRTPRAVAWSDKRSIVSAKEKYTFYREGTPPPPEDRISQPPLIAEEAPYDYKYDHIAPPAPIPVATICGVRKRIFWIILAAILLVVAIAVGVGVGVGVGAKQSQSTTAADAQESGSTNDITATKTVQSAPTDSSFPTTTSDPESTSTATRSKTSKSTAASTISSNPAITTLVSCPAANNTLFKAPGTDKEFVRICGVDYTGKNSAVDLAHAWTPTFEDCMVYCAGYPGCEGCGWGILEDDPGSFHRCWLKRALKTSRTARIGWDFAILR